MDAIRAAALAFGPNRLEPDAASREIGRESRLLPWLRDAHATAPGHGASDLYLVPGEPPMSDPSDSDATAAYHPAPVGGRSAPGTRLAGRYRFIAALGRSGMGEIYRDDDLTRGYSVALKFLPPELVRDPERLARLHAEVRTARQVSQVVSRTQGDPRHHARRTRQCLTGPRRVPPTTSC